jgi:hypothetical protein
MGTTIPGPCRFITTGVERALLSITNCGQTRSINASGGEVLFRRVGTTLSQGQIILVCATLVTVPLDLGAYGTILIQKSSFPIEGPPGIRSQVILIVIEKNILVLELLERLLAD